MSRHTRPPADTEYTVEELPSDATHWRVAFDSRFLRYYWLAGKPRIVTIRDVKQLRTTSESARESKTQLLILLEEAPKPWAANVTNCEIIAMLYGDDFHGWIGKRIELYPTKTRFGREVVDCMRVRESVPGNGHGTGNKDTHELTVDARAMLQALKSAETQEDIDVVHDQLAEAHHLSERESTLVHKAVERRRTQIGGLGQ